MPPPSLQSIKTLQYTTVALGSAFLLFYVFGPTLIPNPAAENRPRTGAVGLSNAANDCFVNSVLQALAGSPALRGYLDSQVQSVHDGHEPDDMDDHLQESNEKLLPSSSTSQTTSGLVTQALKDILDRLHDRRLNGKTISARNFIRSLEYVFQSRFGRQQQDAQELLQVITERIAGEIKARKFLPSSVATALLPFEGTLESQLECETCHFKPEARRTPFTMLTLHVPQNGASTLDECFDGMLKREYIDDYKCDACRLNQAISAAEQQLLRASSDSKKQQLTADIATLRSALETNPELAPELVTNVLPASSPLRRITKYTRIAAYPAILAVHLSRSIYNPGSFSSKNTANVSFDERLRLGGLAESHRYTLMSIVTHRGGHNSGHYETFRRQATDGASKPLLDPQAEDASREQSPKPSNSPLSDPVAGSHLHSKRRTAHSNKWWAISDDKVRECKTKDVLAAVRDVYILIYEKTL